MVTYIRVPSGNGELVAYDLERDYVLEHDFDVGWFVITPNRYFKKYPTEFEAKLYVAGEPKAKFIGFHEDITAAMHAVFGNSTK